MSGPRTSRSSTVWDWLLYVGIGLAILAAAAIYVVGTGGRGEFPFKWLVLIAETPVVFSILIKNRKRQWRQPAFWSVMVGLFVLHCLGFATILLKVDEWQAIWFVPSTVIEVVGFSIVLNRLFPPWKTRSR